MAANAEPEPHCSLFKVTVSPALACLLLELNPDIKTLLASSLNFFLLQWLQTVFVVEEEPFELVVGVSWLYIEPTQDLIDTIKNSIANYVDNFLASYSAIKGEPLTTADLAMMDVTIIAG